MMSGCSKWAGMKFVDAHIHLSDEEYSTCVPEIVAESESSGVVALVSNSMDLKTSLGSLELAERNPRFVYAALGIHPWSVQTLTEQELENTLELVRKQKGNRAVIAIGEVGLDSKYMQIWEKQLKVFDSMLHLAEDLDLPVIIHSRGTTAQVVDMLPSYRLRRVLLHWFSNPISSLSKAVDNGYCISEGVPTVYSKGIREVVKKVPLANLLTETDGPVHFFKPPFKGKRTTPAFIPQVVNAIAEIKGFGSDEVADQVLSNFQQFFGLQLDS
jgi:TatD DNase family protein